MVMITNFAPQGGTPVEKYPIKPIPIDPYTTTTTSAPAIKGNTNNNSSIYVSGLPPVTNVDFAHLIAPGNEEELNLTTIAVGLLLAKAKSEVEFAKMEGYSVKASRRLFLSNDLSSKGVKITEARLDAEVQLDFETQQTMTEVRKKESEVEYLHAIYWGLTSLLRQKQLYIG